MDPVITDPMAVVCVLLAVLAALFGFQLLPVGRKLFGVVPLLVFAYFVPTALSNVGLIPVQSPAYDFIKRWLLPASLVLLTLSVDIPAVLRLGRQAVVLFLAGTASIVLGGPLAYAIVGGLGLIPETLGDQAWKGLAALSGSWIGGGANFIAIGKSVGASDATISLMVVVDVAVANVWMAVLLFFAGRERAMDERLGADRRLIDEVKKKVQAFQARMAHPASMAEMLMILALGLGVTGLALWLSGFLPDIGNIVRGFTWVVILATTAGVALSFTRVRELEGAGASRVGSVFLYLLVASIGAHAEFHRVFQAENLKLVAVGALWMLFHAATMLAVRRALRAPIFFAAVGSQANVGGAASAPVVAAAFHPALAPVGVLLAVAGYVLGTYAGLLCARLLEWVHALVV